MKIPTKLLLAAALAVVAVACVIVWMKVRPVVAVEEQVRANLKDPESAKFTEVTWNAEKKAGCGYVNAKTAMGGYAGRTHFVLLRGGYLRFRPESRDSGSIEDRVDVARKQLAYAQLVDEYCTSETKAKGN